MSEANAKVIWEGSTKPVEFTYRSFSGDKARRKVDVKQVLYDRDADEIYLKGYCQLREAERTFKVSHIETMLKCGSKRFYWEEWLRWELDLPFDAFQNIDPNTNHGSGDGMFINGRTGEVSVGATAKPTSKIEMSTYKVDDQRRTIGWLLALGIFVMPYVFAWFTFRRGHSALSRLLSFGWLAVFVIAQLDRDSQPASSEPQAAVDKSEAEETCKQSLQCWGKKFSIDAGAKCARPIENLAKYSYEWLDGAFTPRFSHYRWKDQSAGVVTYVGDKIKFQNGFGAWGNYVYECDYSPVAGSVLDVRAAPGRL